jgi:hypothetical protein
MRRRVVFALCSALATASGQQAPAAARQIPIRQVAPPDAATREPLKSITDLVQFADGHVLVNDQRGKRLVLFDPSLSSYVVTADSEGFGPKLYPSDGSITELFYYLGDSAALADMTTRTFVIIGPDGKLGRSMAHPRTSDMRITAAYSGTPAFDPRGRFVYRVSAHSSPPRSAPGQLPPLPRTADTAGVVRADFDTRAVDTIARIVLPVLSPPTVRYDANGKPSGAKMVINPVPPTPDDWALLSDGSLAVLRPGDYHIDWVYADGRKASTPKMPFDWRRLTDADKQAKIDSIKHIIDSVNATGRIYYGIVSMSAGRPKLDTIRPTIEFVPPDRMLDYVPAIRIGALKPDRDNHLWILPTTTRSAVGGGLLYDVVNTQGELFERVQLPAGRTIAGFGRGGVIYLTFGDRTKGFMLEKTHVIRPDKP